IALAGLIYQGVILAVALLPLVAPIRELLRPRTAIPAAIILAIVPIVMIGLLTLSGDTVAHAAMRAAFGEENPIYRNFQRKPGLAPYLVALVAGPSHGVLEIRGFTGFQPVLAHLSDPNARGAAIWTLALFLLGGMIVATLMFAAARARAWWVF